MSGVPGITFKSQKPYDNLCWAACAIMIQSYLDAKNAENDTIWKHILSWFHTSKGDPNILVSIAKKEVSISQKESSQPTFNTLLPLKNLSDTYSHLGIKFDHVDGPIDSEELRQTALSEPLLLVYEDSRDSGKGHVALVAGVEHRAGDDFYLLYDPALEELPADGNRKTYEQLQSTDSGLVWTKTYYGCRAVSPVLA